MFDPRPRDPRTIYIPKGYGKIRFGRAEVGNIILAVAVLTFAFTEFINRYYISDISGVSGNTALAYAVGVGFLAVLSGFLLHELMHKIMAQRIGAWAEFRAYPLGLLLALVFAFVGVFFAAPGAVYIQGMINKRQNGMISLAGPMMNLAVGTIFTLAYFTLVLSLPENIAFVLYFVGLVNLFFAAFNLIPIPPFDGHKVVTWNKGIYLAALGASVVMLLIGLRIIGL